MSNKKCSKATGTSSTYNIISAFFAFILWGCWAYYINGGYGISTRVISSVAQGTASFLITLFMIRVVAYIFSKLLNYGILQLILPSILTVGFTGSCLVFMHYGIGTPNILYTVMPALSVAFVFCMFTTLKLKKIIREGDYT